MLIKNKAKTLLVIFFCIIFCQTLISQEISAFWKSINEKTGLPECMVAIYKYQNEYYGRIIGTYNEQGIMNDTLDNPKERSQGMPGSPFYCGMDILWGLKPNSSKYKGKIVDPRNGNVYKAEVWTEKGNLVIRGKYLFFGKNTTWYPAAESDFPSDFKRPDVAQFIPLIPVE
jgi:uncharacterized protein (DUF2147 family)